MRELWISGNVSDGSVCTILVKVFTRHNIRATSWASRLLFSTGCFSQRHVVQFQRFLRVRKNIHSAVSCATWPFVYDLFVSSKPVELPIVIAQCCTIPARPHCNNGPTYVNRRLDSVAFACRIDFLLQVHPSRPPCCFFFRASLLLFPPSCSRQNRVRARVRTARACLERNAMKCGYVVPRQFTILSKFESTSFGSFDSNRAP